MGASLAFDSGIVIRTTLAYNLSITQGPLLHNLHIKQFLLAFTFPKSLSLGLYG